MNLEDRQARNQIKVERNHCTLKNQISNLVSDPINNQVNQVKDQIWWPTYEQIIRQIKIPIWNQIDSQKQTN